MLEVSMKKFFILTMILFTVSCSTDSKTAQLELNSMQCLMCSMKVEEAIAELKGVKKIEVNLKGKSGKVIYNSSVLDLATIEKTISKLGYDINDKKADLIAYNNLELCCKKPEK